MATSPSWWQRLTGRVPEAAPPRDLPVEGPRAASAAAWDPEVLARVRRLHITARVLTDGLVHGAHRSRRIGQAVEFADYQEYAPGMDLRHVDWRVWGRSDRVVVRRYEAETELPCTIVLDLSADLGTGRGGRGTLPALEGSKAGAAITLAATVAYWLHRQGEPVGLEIIGGEGMRWAAIPPRAGRSHLQLLFSALATARPAGRASLGAALSALGAKARRRSLVVVITDGMEEPEVWLPALGAFARRGADLRLVHLFDRDELRLSHPESAVFFSPEGGEALAVDPSGAREAFELVVGEYLAEVRAGVLRHGGQYVAAASQDDLAAVLRRLAAGASSPAGGRP